MRSKQLVSVLLWLCLAALVLTVPDMSVSPVDADQLEKEMSDINAQILQNEQAGLKNLRDAATGLGGGQSNAYVCTNGQNPANMSYKDYINAFAAGPCTPVVFLGGITATKLQVVIDCPTLKEKSPQVFADCKWTTCTKNIFNTGCPKDEYTIWVADLLAPMTIINPNAAQKKCFVGLFGLRWTKGADGKLTPSETTGIKIKPMGFSPGTRTTSRCGFDAVSGTLPSSVAPDKERGYAKFRIALEDMGYKIGISLQAMPYDWRRPYYDNEVHHEFNTLIGEMVSITGKKISVVAHSFGNINMANSLSQLTSDQRNAWIQRYFAIAPPYLGSSSSWSMVMGAQGDATTMDFFTLSGSLSTFPSVYDLMPRASWTMYSNTNWMKSIKNRMQLDQGKAPIYSIPAKEDIVKNVYPSATDTCYNKAWKARSGMSCTSGISDYSDFGKVVNDVVHDENIGHTLDAYSYYTYAKLLFDGADKRADYDRLDNPQVQTVIIYSNMASTDKWFYWDYNPRTQTEANPPNFAKPTTIKQELGDSFVVTSSTLVAGFKWAYEHDMQTTPNSKPIIFAELCSIKNPKSNVYQSGTSVTDNQYQSINCSCNPDDVTPCAHNDMIKEPNLVNYVVNSLLDRQVASTSRKFNSWTEAQVKSYVDNCNLLFNSE
jgi:hypothetical protein